MNIPNPITWIRERRTAKGFGVHSPFAYRFILEVLFQPCGYYAYDFLPDSESVRRLYRILLYFSPSEVDYKGADDNVKKTISLASEGFDWCKKCRKLQIVDDAGLQLDMDSDAIVIFGRKASGQMSPKLSARFDGISSGMMFVGRDMLVAVSDKKLPRQDFNLPI